MPLPRVSELQRSSVSAMILLLCIGWAVLAWLWPTRHAEAPMIWPPSLLWHKIASVLLGTLVAIHLFVSVSFEQTE